MGGNIPAKLVRNGHTSAIDSSVTSVMHVRAGREDALVQVLPADVLQPGVVVAHVHLESVLDLLCLLECGDSEFSALVSGEGLVPLDAVATVPQEHAPAVQGPDGLLRRLARRLQRTSHAVTGFAREKQGVLTPRVREQYADQAFFDSR